MKSVSGWAAYLNGVPYTRKSKTQPFVTLSSAEAESVAANSCALDMLFGMQLLESMGLKVKKPMTLWVDNKGAVDLYNSWSVSGNTRAISVRLAHIRELKEQGILEVKWIAGQDNPADLFTKNLDGTTYKKHQAKFVRKIPEEKVATGGAKDEGTIGSSEVGSSASTAMGKTVRIELGGVSEGG